MMSLWAVGAAAEGLETRVRRMMRLGLRVGGEDRGGGSAWRVERAIG